LRPVKNSARPWPASLEDLAASIAAQPAEEGAGPRASPAGASARLPRSFALETTLDRRYFQGLLDALDGLDRVDQDEIRPLVQQEVDHFHLMLVARGRFLHGLETAALLPFHAGGTGITREILRQMLSASDLAGAAARAVGLALDAAPSVEQLEAMILDALAWRRFLRLARRIFRECSMGFAGWWATPPSGAWR